MSEWVYLVRRVSVHPPGSEIPPRDVAHFDSLAEAERYARALAAAEGTIDDQTRPTPDERLLRVNTTDYNYLVLARQLYPDAEAANDDLVYGVDL